MVRFDLNYAGRNKKATDKSYPPASLMGFNELPPDTDLVSVLFLEIYHQK